jgi:hypothetical protein
MKESIMGGYVRFSRVLLTASAVLASLFFPLRGWAQATGNAAPPRSDASSQADVKALTDLVRQLQTQVQALNARVLDLEAKEKAAVAEPQKLRGELVATKNTTAAGITDNRNRYGTGMTVAEPLSTTADQDTANREASMPATSPQTPDERISQLEENLELANSKIKEQSQTKVESSSKYRVRLSGLALFNLFTNRGIVDNQDIPQIAVPAGPLDSAGTFGGSLRQSQIGLQGFGPDIAGAHTSAEIRFDFAGGFPPAPNGELNGLVRLRTGTVRFDWANTSISAGQDYLFFSPLTPTSYASLAIPAFSYSGNLWGWTPQVRVEHRFHVSEESTVSVQGGIVQTLSGDHPDDTHSRRSTWGEASGQPGYAVRIAWSHPAFGQNIVAGLGGYYGRQYWGFGRNVDGWAGSADVTVPLGRFVEFTGQFYRGKAVGGLGGGIGQNVLWNGLFNDPATEVYGLNSMGGWIQLKLKPAIKFEMNGAFGDDNPFASDLRPFIENPIYLHSLLSKNQTALANLVYRPRSNVILSLEYRHLKTFTLDSNSSSANTINLIIGYIF